MRIETSLGTFLAVGVVIFISGEAYGYLKCKIDELSRNN